MSLESLSRRWPCRPCILLAVTAASFWRYGRRLRIGCLSRVARILYIEGVQGLLASVLLRVEPQDPASPVDDAHDAVDRPELALLDSWPQCCLEGIQAGKFDVPEVVDTVDQPLTESLSDHPVSGTPVREPDSSSDLVIRLSLSYQLHSSAGLGGGSRTVALWLHAALDTYVSSPSSPCAVVATEPLK